MTIDKNDEPDLRTSEENNSQKSKQGFSDPSGQFPKLPYVFESSLNKATRSKIKHDLSIGGGLDGLSVDLPPMQESRYPYNNVMETVSGHVVEYDDTPGAERILIKHNSGSGIEMRTDGSMVMKTEANSVTSIAGSSKLIVEGDANMKFAGNLSLDVAGDLDLNVGGNINVNAAGNKSETISGSSRENVNGAKGSVVRGSRSETTVGTVTNTSLSGHNEIIKGSSRKSVDGDAIWGVSGSLKQTAEGQMILSTDDMDIGAQNLSVFGASGTIGGEGMVHYGVTYYGTSFYGDLRGTALQAVTADVTNSQNYPSDQVGSTSGYTADDDGTATASASSDTMDNYLNQSANGSMKISIDEGDYLKNIIDKTEQSGGISEKPLNIRETRSALRDPANMGNSTFTGYSVSAGTLSPNYSKGIPKTVGRISSSTPDVKIPYEPINENLIKSTRYTNSKNKDIQTFIPDPKYDPNRLDSTTPITGKIELSEGVKLSKFLGGTGDKVTLSHISTRDEKLALARQYALHASAINTVLKNRGEFKDHRLVVVDGLYKAGPSETITPDSINDRRQSGRTVVYELHNSKGEIDNEKTYDLALWWKDILNFDKLILSYDTFDPNCDMCTQLILEMPEVDADYNLTAKYKNELVTLFNNNIQGNELIEITEV